jgi:hypothetical protein
MRRLLNSRKYRALGSALAGFAGYGSWGFWVNMSHGWQSGLKAGLTQGSYSFVITLIYSGLIEWMYARTGNKILTTLLCSLSVILTSYSIHALVGTPEILATIAPGAVIGSIFVYGYASVLASTVTKSEIATGSAEKQDD